MKNISKRIFFWTLFFLFFVTAPLVVFYSMGYRFSPQRGIFVYTGSISIKSSPQDVEIYIDHQLNKKKLNRINNSFHIGGIKPGEHLIEVKAPGFNTWAKKITVSSGTSTEFWNVSLVKENYERIAYPTEGIERFFFDPGKKLIAYTKNTDSAFSVNILDIESEESTEVFSSGDYRFTPDEKENIEWSPQSKEIIVPVIKGEEKDYIFIDVKTKETLSLVELSMSNKPEKVRWDQHNKNFIYYLSEGNLWYIDAEKPEDKKINAQNISSYELSSSYVYYFQLPGGIIYRTNPEGTSQPEQITTSAPEKMNDPNYQITVYDRDRIAILNKNGDLYVQNIGEKGQYFRNFGSGIKEIQFSDDGKKMMYWSDFEIFVYFVRNWEVQPWRNENDQKEIVRFSEKIENIQWTRDYEHVIFNVGKKMKIAEIDNRSQNNISDLTSFSLEKTQIVSDLGEGIIYFLDNNQQAKNLYSIEFPEKETAIF